MDERTCDVCGIKVSGVANWDAHVAGAKHKKALTKQAAGAMAPSASVAVPVPAPHCQGSSVETGLPRASPLKVPPSEFICATTNATLGGLPSLRALSWNMDGNAVTADAVTVMSGFRPSVVALQGVDASTRSQSAKTIKSLSMARALLYDIQEEEEEEKRRGEGDGKEEKTTRENGDEVPRCTEAHIEWDLQPYAHPETSQPCLLGIAVTRGSAAVVQRFHTSLGARWQQQRFLDQGASTLGAHLSPLTSAAHAARGLALHVRAPVIMGEAVAPTIAHHDILIVTASTSIGLLPSMTIPRLRRDGQRETPSTQLQSELGATLVAWVAELVSMVKSTAGSAQPAVLLCGDVGIDRPITRAAITRYPVSSNEVTNLCRMAFTGRCHVASKDSAQAAPAAAFKGMPPRPISISIVVDPPLSYSPGGRFLVSVSCRPCPPEFRGYNWTLALPNIHAGRQGCGPRAVMWRTIVESRTSSSKGNDVAEGSTRQDFVLPVPEVIGDALSLRTLQWTWHPSDDEELGRSSRGEAPTAQDAIRAIEAMDVIASINDPMSDSRQGTDSAGGVAALTERGTTTFTDVFENYRRMCAMRDAGSETSQVTDAVATLIPPHFCALNEDTPGPWFTRIHLPACAADWTSRAREAMLVHRLEMQRVWQMPTLLEVVGRQLVRGQGDAERPWNHATLPLVADLSVL